MEKLCKRMLMIILVFALFCLAGCDSAKKTVIDDIQVTKLDHVSLTICYQGNEPDGMKEVLAEVEKQSASELNASIDFQFFYMPTDQYFSQVESLIASGQNCDAFMVTDGRKQVLESFVENGIAADITDLFSKYAPNLYAQIDSRAKEYARVNGRIYAVPRLLPTPDRLSVNIRTDLLQKYEIGSVTNYDELEAFLAKIKENEPELYPLTTGYNSISLFAPSYGYVILDEETGLVYKWNDKDMTISAWEQTPEYLEAENRLASWYRSKYIVPGHNIQTDAIMYKSGKWAAIITRAGDSVYYNLRNLSDDDSSDYSYTEFPLYPEIKASKMSPLVLSFVIGNQSKNKERVLMFLDWIQSDISNYRLLRYGLEGRDYTVVNDAISLPQASRLPDDMFVNWYGGLALMNMKLEGPYWMGDHSMNFNRYWEELCKNTEYIPHSGFVPDYSAVYVCYVTRRSSRNDTLSRMNLGQYKQKDSEDYIEKMKSAGTDELVKVIQSQLDGWRENSMK